MPRRDYSWLFRTAKSSWGFCNAVAAGSMIVAWWTDLIALKLSVGKALGFGGGMPNDWGKCPSQAREDMSIRTTSVVRSANFMTPRTNHFLHLCQRHPFS